MKENDFKRQMVECLRQRGAHVTVIENMTGVGCPDLHILSETGDKWVETKGPSSMTKEYVRLRKTQHVWMAKRYALGKNTWIVAYDGNRYELYGYVPSWVLPLNEVYVKIPRDSFLMTLDSLNDLIYTLLT